MYTYFVSKENLFVVRLLINNWNYFWSKYCNLRFLAICLSQYPLLIFLALSWYQKAKIALRTSMRNKKIFCTKRPIEEKKNYCRFNRLHKVTCYKTKSNFSGFVILHCLLNEFFLFPYKSRCNWSVDPPWLSLHYMQNLL